MTDKTDHQAAGVCPEAALAAAQAPQQPDPWRAAVDDALVSAGLDCTATDTKPAAALSLLLEWNRTLALDPAVSSDAAALIERGRQEAPQQPARVALTIPQIKEIWAQHPELSDPGFVLVPFVRAVERAHGIPGTDGTA